MGLNIHAGATCTPPPTPSPSPSPKPVPSPIPVPVVPEPVPVAPIPVPDPEPSPVALSCSYQGTFRISPAYSPCNTKFVTLTATATASNCSKATVNLRSATQMRNRMKLAEWAISTPPEGALGSPLNILARASCSARALTVPGDLTNLALGELTSRWKIVPADTGDDCNLVNLIPYDSTRQIVLLRYLSVPRTCDRFTFAGSDGGRQRFVLKKIT